MRVVAKPFVDFDTALSESVLAVDPFNFLATEAYDEDAVGGAALLLSEDSASPRCLCDGLLLASPLTF